MNKIPGAVYETKGRAREYRELAAELYRGCQHGCRYCYVAQLKHIPTQEFQQARPIRGVIEKLETSAKWLAREGDARQVMLCFGCDPYQPINEQYQLARQAIKALCVQGQHVCILTKGGMLATGDFDLLTPKDSFATTLTFIDPAKSVAWEPRAALPKQRLASLEMAHNCGIHTWVSLEPVIEPEETLECIRASHEFVDGYKVGTLNYLPEAKGIDWREFGFDAISLLQELKKAFYLKKDLRDKLPPRMSLPPEVSSGREI